MKIHFCDLCGGETSKYGYTDVIVMERLTSDGKTESKYTMEVCAECDQRIGQFIRSLKLEEAKPRFAAKENV